MGANQTHWSDKVNICESITPKYAVFLPCTHPVLWLPCQISQQLTCSVPADTQHTNAKLRSLRQHPNTQKRPPSTALHSAAKGPRYQLGQTIEISLKSHRTDSCPAHTIRSGCPAQTSGIPPVMFSPANPQHVRVPPKPHNPPKMTFTALHLIVSGHTTTMTRLCKHS